MSRPAKRTQCDPLAAFAKQKIQQWREQDNFTMQELATVGLSKPVIHRILSNGKGLPREEWLCALAKLFGRINEVLPPNKRRRSWQEVFGHDFPMPPLLPDSTLSNYADVARRELRRLARPLAEFLDAEFSAAYDQRNLWKASQLLIRLCEIYELADEWDRAAVKFAILAQLYEETGAFHFAADALLRQGVALFYNGLPVDAEVCFRKGLKLVARHASKTIPQRTSLRLLNYLAMARSEQGDPEQARHILETQSLPQARDRGSAAAVTSVWNRLGVVCLKLNDVSAAFDYLVNALEKRAGLEMRSEAARTLLTLGTAHERRGELPQAIGAWRLSAELQKKLRDHEWRARTYYELGRAYGLMSRTPPKIQPTPIVIAFDESSFPDLRELQALKKLSGRENPPPIVLKHERLVSMAREELEAAIWWDTEASGASYAKLAGTELKALQDRGSQPSDGTHGGKNRPD